eukprot:TRINITY_DN31611_c0_g1_i1.p1 TRINITY_DN31611_c0_g1~~TRINITY_DN31611_c0_g1_i1.p1  ORF type:complete len:147 (+),score=4.42 TRINITY_DN31611_c0_g1_i1:182-622(+)
MMCHPTPMQNLLSTGGTLHRSTLTEGHSHLVEQDNVTWPLNTRKLDNFRVYFKILEAKKKRPNRKIRSLNPRKRWEKKGNRRWLVVGKRVTGFTSKPLLSFFSFPSFPPPQILMTILYVHVLPSFHTHTHTHVFFANTKTNSEIIK